MIYVVLSRACFGLIISDIVDLHSRREAVVIDAPPIARWTIGKPARQVWDYYAGRGTVRWVP